MHSLKLATTEFEMIILLISVLFSVMWELFCLRLTIHLSVHGNGSFCEVFLFSLQVEGILSKTRYLTGDSLTEADVRLFPTLVRFDLVYHGHFKVRMIVILKRINNNVLLKNPTYCLF